LPAVGEGDRPAAEPLLAEYLQWINGVGRRRSLEAQVTAPSSASPRALFAREMVQKNENRFSIDAACIRDDNERGMHPRQP
jgi:hypothetical protein